MSARLGWNRRLAAACAFCLAILVCMVGIRLCGNQGAQAVVPSQHESHLVNSVALALAKLDHAVDVAAKSPAPGRPSPDTRGARGSASVEVETADRDEAPARKDRRRGRPVDVDLARIFLYGNLRADVLQRHSLLNRKGDVLAGSDWDQLVALVADCNARYDSIALSHRELMASEMSNALASGVAPLSVTPVASDAIIRAAAKHHSQSSGLSRGEAEAAMRKPGVTLGSGGVDVIIYGGKTFLQSGFAVLPRSDESFDKVKFFAFENLVSVVAFFRAKNLTWEDDKLQDAIRALVALTPAQHRGVR